jgi:hypothetical protein
MLIQEKNLRPVYGRNAGEKRTGIDRRVLSYDWQIPERRAAAERRLGRECAISNDGEWRDRQPYG